jgi:hypothetical protein
VKVKPLIDFIYRNFYLIFLFLPTIIPFFILSFFNHPAADDFCLADTVKDMGVIGAQIHWYTTWTGRFFSTFLITNNPLSVDSILLYKLVAIVLQSLFVLGIYLVINTLAKNNLTKLQKFTGTILFFWFFVAEMPTILEGLYWLAGSYTYFVSIILSAFAIYFSLKTLTEDDGKKRRNFIISTILLFFAIGSNETTMIVWDILLVLFNIAFLIKNRKFNKYLIILLVVAVIASALVYFAPGNTLRAAGTSTLRGDLLWSIRESLIASKDIFKSWIIGTPLLIVLTLMVYPISKFIREKKDIASKIYFHPIFALVAGSLAVVGAFFGAFFGVGSYPPERSVNISFFVFFVFSIYFVFSLIYFLTKRNIEIKPLPFYVLCLIFFLLVIYIPTSRNLLTPVRTLLSGAASRYDTAQFDRYKTIEECRASGVKDCVVETRTDYAPGISAEDIKTDPTDWVNLCVADYYELNTIKTK